MKYDRLRLSTLITGNGVGKVLIMFLDHADEDGSVPRWSQTEIIRRSGVSERTLRRSLAKLEELGFIAKVPVANDYRRSVYRVLWSSIRSL